VPSIGWHAYYGLFAAFGAWLVIASVLARVPALAVAVVLAVAALRPLRAATPSWDWSSTAYQARASTYLGALRDSLRARHPTLAPRTRLFVTQVPEGIRLVSADGAALRVWYGDPTLRAAYLSQYQPRGAADSTGRDLFFRFDTTGAWIEIVHGDEDVAAARLADPAWEEDHRDLALALGRGGDWAGAAAEVAKLVAAFPDRFDYALNLARCYEGMGDEILARKWYAKAAATPGASPAAKAAPLAYEARLRERRAQP
jgi:hypothetical protein